MSNAASHVRRLIKQLSTAVAKNLTHWAILGTVIALTGFGPEHWFAAAFRYIPVPESAGLTWLSWLDIRVAIVCVGVAIVVADVLVRRRALRQEQNIIAVPGAVAPSIDPARTVRIQPSIPGDAGLDRDRPTDASEEGAHPTDLSLPEQPSIVVLPFTNMSGEPEQEFFADGLTEDIITELSRFRHLFIISRNSAFKYKGKAVDVRQAARELRVQYVVEGSVRKVGSRVRITVQLIEGTEDRHIWAERYDRQLEDIFAIQDEVTAAIVATLPGRVDAATSERVSRKPTHNMAAYECLLAGKVNHHRSTRADNETALRLLDRALALDPNYAHAHAWKACTLGQSWVYGYCEDREATWNQVVGELQTALNLDSNDSDVHRILAAVNLASGNHDKAFYHQQRALSLNPNDDLVVVQQGELLTWLGQPEEGLQWIEKAMRLNPYHPERFWNHLGRAHFVAHRYGDAISAFGHITAPDQFHHAFLAACHARLGDEVSAGTHATEVLRRDPSFTIDSYLKTLHYKQAKDRKHHREALLKTGLPVEHAGAAAAETATQSAGIGKPQA
jgi:adenylate cyclase